MFLETVGIPGSWQKPATYRLDGWMDGWVERRKEGWKDGYFKLIQHCFLSHLTLDWLLTLLIFPRETTLYFSHHTFPGPSESPLGMSICRLEGSQLYPPTNRLEKTTFSISTRHWSRIILFPAMSSNHFSRFSGTSSPFLDQFCHQPSSPSPPLPERTCEMM